MPGISPRSACFLQLFYNDRSIFPAAVNFASRTELTCGAPPLDHQHYMLQCTTTCCAPPLRCTPTWHHHLTTSTCCAPPLAVHHHCSALPPS
eukprot:364955-Chlamydomonas_euryale.AAC.17